MESYLYYYEKESHDIDLNTLLETQQEFAVILQEINAYRFPQTELAFKVLPSSKGSYIFEIFTTVVRVGGLIYAKKDDIKNFYEVVKGIIDLKKHLANKNTNIPEKVIPSTIINNTYNVTVVINDRESTINIPEQSYRSYKSNKKINEAVKKIAKILDDDKETRGLKVIEGSTQKEIIHIDQHSIESMKQPNQFIDKPKEKINEVNNQELHVKVIDYIPDKKSKFSFIWNEKITSFLITAPVFYERINKGEKFGKNDTIIGDVKVYSKLNAKSDEYIPYSYELFNIKSFRKSGEGQESLFE